jgi:hypothetical protein
MELEVQRKKIKATSFIANGSTTGSAIQDGQKSLEGTSIAFHKISLDKGLQLPGLPEEIHDPISTDTSTVSQPLEESATLNSKFKSLREGCYYIQFTQFSGPENSEFIHYNGTMRVQREGSSTIASGDLYFHQTSIGQNSSSSPVTEPDPASGIPIFPINKYRYYIRVTKILEESAPTTGFTFEFELHRYTPRPRFPRWNKEGTYRSTMTWVPAPTGYPSDSDFLTGMVKNSNDMIFGSITMGWVSSFLRRATVQIDKVSSAEWPLDNGSGVNWQTIFGLVGWDIKVIQSSSDIDKSGSVHGGGPDKSWSKAELHASMLFFKKVAKSPDLDTEWRYHLLCVELIEVDPPLGIMYDRLFADCNDVSREGSGISSHWEIPNEDKWGLVKGMRYGTATAPYFRTAVHEVAHACGLDHNKIDNGIMNITGDIAGNAVPPIQFPNNIQWSFAPDDSKRLRHFPDIFVRPGGQEFTPQQQDIPISSDNAIPTPKGLKLEVIPQLETVPLGAPVRVNFGLTNTADASLTVPIDLSMDGGHVSGTVIDPAGVVRTFFPMLKCVDENKLRMLEPGETMSHSVTLLGGTEGPLFPYPGFFKIIVQVSWEVNGTQTSASGENGIMVTPPHDEEHASAAQQLLSTPDALLVLTIGGDYLKDGISAIQRCLDNKVLKPHFAFIEAKRIGTRFGKRNAELEKAIGLLDESTIMSPAEIKRAAKLIGADNKALPKDIIKRASEVLRAKLRDARVDEETLRMVNSIQP